jgi:guanylate kinase
LEWAEVHGNLYGTSKAEIDGRRGDRGIVFDIDHQGARQIKCAAPDAVAVFILPPSMAVLEQRLRGRASEDEETVQRRFGIAKREIEHYGLFDYVLVNAELEEATRKLTSIFLAEECRRSRVAALAEQFLAEGRLRSQPH